VIPALLLGLAACGDPEDTSLAALCDDAPVVTWNNFGDGFLTENCRACHSVNAYDRHDAPDDLNFDTLDDVRPQVPVMLAHTTGTAPDMPPEGGVAEDDRYLFEVWLKCYPP
jgi:mono/diheme cytochrome c family protein